MKQRTSTLLCGIFLVCFGMACAVQAAMVVDLTDPSQNPGSILQSAVRAAGAESEMLVLADGNWSITNNMTVPANITLKLNDSAFFTIENDAVLIIAGRLIAPPARIFHGQGKVKYRGIAYPQWWGAVGDGTTDDYEAIQAAIDAVTTTRGTGGWGAVHLPSGIYLTSSTLKLNNCMTLEGDTQFNTVVYYNGPEHAISINGHLATIRDLHVTALSPFTKDWMRSIRVGFGRAKAAILIQGVEAKILNCIITYFNNAARQSVAVKTAGKHCFSGLIQNSYIRYCWGGVSLEDVVTDWSVIETTILDVTKFGISLGYDWTEGKKTTFTGDNFRFERCLIENINNAMNETKKIGAGYAIFLARGSVINIRGVYIEDFDAEEGHTAYGIYANDMADGSSLLQINIEGCNIASSHSPLSESIHLENQWYGTISGNHLSQGRNQIRQMPSSRWVHIGQNYFTANSNDSIALEGGSSLAFELSHRRIKVSPDLQDSALVQNYGMQEGHRLLHRMIILTDGKSRPDVSNCGVLKIAVKTATVITGFRGGEAGQVIHVLFANNKALIDFTDSQLKGNKGQDWNSMPDDHMTAVFDGEFWYCNISQNSPKTVP